MSASFGFTFAVLALTFMFDEGPLTRGALFVVLFFGFVGCLIGEVVESIIDRKRSIDRLKRDIDVNISVNRARADEIRSTAKQRAQAIQRALRGR